MGKGRKAKAQVAFTSAIRHPPYVMRLTEMKPEKD
jgi:hypothetical protein